MIKNLHISNYALLKNVIVNFLDGFTVISGETGAGKSIMLDALSLLLGKRVERFSTSKSTPKSIIEGVFVLNNSHKKFFKEHDLDFEEETVVRREINANGKSRAFINDTPVLLHVLSKFGQQIIEIFAQDQTIVLKDENAQFQLIDQLSKSAQELENYRTNFSALSQLKKDLEIIQSQGSLSVAEIEFLQFQFKELTNANIRIGEKQEIEDKINLLENIDGIAHTIAEAELLLNNEQGIMSSLSVIKRNLADFDNLSLLSDRIESIIIELNDINTEFLSINNSLTTEPEQLQEMNNRLDLLNSLLQKHRLNFIQQLIELKDDFHARIELSSSFDILLTEKQEQIEVKKKELLTAAHILNKKRLNIFTDIKRKVEEILKKLGMPFAQFKIEMQETEQFSLNGNTTILFKFSANKGTEMQELSKVASGGELSRLMLAIKYITAQSSQVGTLIFDEIDAGVSGEIASLMGDMMRNISKSTQLIAISHLPQIASKARAHLKVMKSVVKEETISTIIQLDKEGRVEEIAKLLSGKTLTQSAIDNAVDLLNQ
jgi:DNA repair protein RecN (Recombination protein N)